ncbi:MULTISPECIES: hypothetical protein [unclassified Shinella]|uniref:hypothetical protein n=1 Tax=unclassified Shinella TaxID=2643062 RepID=UPI00234E5B16|nr:MULTISPECIES: hypothetical protein [unclassified Shinella]MCO5153394.1 hypothetical protein [Shinella sp.]MDC7260573.1 hypothetical protein [Shinella sp. HY16]MDC7267468.1 hypothetical protein [Shinella sp. YZ44]
MTALLTICVLLICAAITSAIAKRKGLNAGAWAVIGFVFGVFALIVVPFWPRSKSEQPAQSYAPNLIVGGIGLAGALVVLTQTNVLTELSKGTYDCDNLVPEIVSLSAEQASGAKILGIFEIKTVKKEPETTECTGLAVMSDQSKQNVSYKAYIEYDQWWIVYNFI